MHANNIFIFLFIISNQDLTHSAKVPSQMWVLGTIHTHNWKLNILLITQPAYKLNITII